MKDKQIRILRHTTGADSNSPGYRNYFAAGGDDVDICESLVELGLMERKEVDKEICPDEYFRVTDQGFKLLGIKRP